MKRVIRFTNSGSEYDLPAGIESDEQIASAAAEVGEKGDYEVYESDEGPLSGQMGEEKPAPFNGYPQGDLTQKFASKFETAGKVGKYAAPIVAPMMTPLGPIGQTAAYAVPAAIEQTARMVQGKPADWPGVLAGTAGQLFANKLQAVAPSFKALSPTASTGKSILVDTGVQTVAALGGNVVERALRGQSLTPSLLESIVAGVFSIPAGIAKTQVGKLQVREDKLDQAVDILRNDYMLSLEDARRSAPYYVAATDPEVASDLGFLLKETPEKVPDPFGAGEVLSQTAVSELAGVGVPGGMSRADVTNLGYQVNPELVQAGEEAIESGLDVIKRRNITQPIPTAAEQAAAQAGLKRSLDQARQVSEQANQNLADMVAVQMANEFISRGGAASNAADMAERAGGGAIRVGEEMTRSAKAQAAFLKTIGTKRYDLLNEAVANSPTRANPVNLDMGEGEIELQAMLAELEKQGVTDVSSRIRNVFDQLYPANGAPKTVAQVIEALPSLTSAANVVKKSRLEDKRKLSRQLALIQDKVFSALGEASAGDPNLMRASRRARAAWSKFSDADTVHYKLSRTDPKTLGEQVLSARVESGESIAWRNLAEILRPAKPLKSNLEETVRRETIARIMSGSVDPVSGQVDLNRLTKEITDARLPLGDKLYKDFVSILRQAGQSAAKQKQLVAMAKYSEGRLGSAILNDLDPAALSLAMSIDPQHAERLKTAALNQLIDKAKTPKGIDLDVMRNDPAIRRLLDENIEEASVMWPELADILEGKGATQAIENANFTKKIVDRFALSDANTLQKIMLNNAEIGAPEIAKFKEIVLSRKDGIAMWDRIRTSFWQDQMIDPATGALDPSRWMHNEKGWSGFPEDALAEMAGMAGGSGPLLSKSEALARVKKWDKLMRKLADYSEVFSRTVPGMSPMAARAEKIERFALAAGGLGALGSGSKARGDWVLLSVVQNWLNQLGAEVTATRLFDRNRDALTDRLTEALKQIDLAATNVIDSVIPAPEKRPALNK